MLIREKFFTLQTLNHCQTIKNEAARKLTRSNRWSHITPVLRSPIWLPVAHRIQFKICTLTYKALHGLAPVYFSELPHPYSSAHPPRSNMFDLLFPIVRPEWIELLRL